MSDDLPSSDSLNPSSIPDFVRGGGEGGGMVHGSGLQGKIWGCWIGAGRVVEGKVRVNNIQCPDPEGEVSPITGKT